MKIRSLRKFQQKKQAFPLSALTDLLMGAFVPSGKEAMGKFQNLTIENSHNTQNRNRVLNQQKRTEKIRTII
jgi:hypothetical protein